MSFEEQPRPPMTPEARAWLWTLLLLSACTSAAVIRLLWWALS